MTTISIDMPNEIVDELHRRAPEPEVRNALVERIFRAYFSATQGVMISDADLLNRHADALNAEAEDVLSYQVYLEKG